MGLAPLIRASKSLRRTQVLGAAFVFMNSFVITVMAFRADGSSSLYYAGLNLVISGVLAFIPSTLGFSIAYLAIIVGPFYLFSWIAGHVASSLLVESFFLFGNSTILWGLRACLEELRMRELCARLQLKDEIADRERVIRIKTEEGLRLSALSQQFSPQIVQAIRSGTLSLDGEVHESKICAIFIDIVDSTSKSTHLSKSSFDRVIAMFMEDTIPILLKYDITIDKFLGDGVLAFSNDPVAHADYVRRVADAALEIRERIAMRSEEYATHWGEELGIRVGIAEGAASVGFYGSRRNFKTYTALGPVMSLASRLCGAALPGQILVSQDVLEALKSSSLKISKAGHSRLKGFDSQQGFLHELNRKTAADADQKADKNGVSEPRALLKAA
jgi:class 3 adenylate cyclase